MITPFLWRISRLALVRFKTARSERDTSLVKYERHGIYQYSDLLERYGEQIHAGRGNLMLTGVSEHAKEQLDLTETTEEHLGEENIFMATEILGESGRVAYAAAQKWLEILEQNSDGVE
ncbi:MAG: hypothetical protein GQ524_09955 [Anaerolineales bacterium]|nr:hypothetical protein [Anaerolineales bacterium]